MPQPPLPVQTSSLMLPQPRLPRSHPSTRSPASLRQSRQQHLLTGKGAGAPRGSGGGGAAAGTAAPLPLIWRVPGLTPGSGAPQASLLRRTHSDSRGRRAPWQRCGGSWQCVASRVSERLPAPPPRAGTARSDVSTAPPSPPPSPHPDQCGMEGAEASCEGHPAPRPGASFLLPLGSLLFPGSRGAIQAFHSPAPPGSSRATNNLGGGGEQRSGLEASLVALSSGIWGFGENE